MHASKSKLLDVEVCAANNSREAPLIQYFLYDL